MQNPLSGHNFNRIECREQENREPIENKAMACVCFATAEQLMLSQYV